MNQEDETRIRFFRPDWKSVDENMKRSKYRIHQQVTGRGHSGND